VRVHDDCWICSYATPASGWGVCVCSMSWDEIT
jgi:hypothetical protein